MIFKICSIGCGNHATYVHGPSYERYASEHADTVLAACCDINPAAAEAFKIKFGFERCYSDFIKMLDTEKPDAVCLVSPVEYTAVLAEAILKKGYPLILEKPPGRNSDEVGRLIEISCKNNIPNRVAFNRRYMPLVRELKCLLEKNLQVSGIQSIACDMFRVDRKDEDFSATAIHAIDAVKFLAGSYYKHIRFHYRKYPQLGPGVKDIFMDCSFESGARAGINICPVTGVSIERITINAYNHTFFLNMPESGIDSPGKLLHIRQGQVETNATGDDVSDGINSFESGGFFFENASFFDAVRAGRVPEGSLEDSLQSVEVADCIRRELPEYG